VADRPDAAPAGAILRSAGAGLARLLRLAGPRVARPTGTAAIRAGGRVADAFAGRRAALARNAAGEAGHALEAVAKTEERFVATDVAVLAAAGVARETTLVVAALGVRRRATVAHAAGAPCVATLIGAAVARAAVAVRGARPADRLQRADALTVLGAGEAIGAVATRAIAAAAIRAALFSSAIRGAALPARVALVGRRLTTSPHRAAAGGGWLAGGVAAEVHPFGTDEIEAVLRAAVARLRAGVTIRGAFPRSQAWRLAMAPVVTIPFLAAVTLGMLVLVVCLVRGARPSRLLHALLAETLVLALATFRQEVGEFTAAEAEAEQGTKGKAA
jgi:hypothetical protein